jgi:GTP-binding protein
MLSDHASINVRGGDGGAGSVSFRREKHVPRGGPDGGNGGPGGDVVIVATRQFRDLSYFRHKVHFKGQRGGHGMGQKRHGKAGVPTIVEVPVGTEIRDRDGTLLADLTVEGQRIVVARGDEGGRGNTCFVSSTRRVPRFAENGLPGEEHWLDLQLKLLADIGLVGLPNAGKSSLLAALTRARPKVASYPFTTLEPNLGTLELGERVVVIADIPGLIEGASAGTGLGDRFLAHVERTVLLVYVVDASQGPDEALAAVTTVRGDEVAEVVAALEPVTRDFAGPVVAVSATKATGLKDFVRELDALFSAQVAAALEAVGQEASRLAPVVLRPSDERVGDFTVEREQEAWRVSGRVLERLVAKADLGNDEAMRYLQEVMERAGLSAAIRKAGGVDGDTVKIGDAEFELG